MRSRMMSLLDPPIAYHPLDIPLRCSPWLSPLVTPTSRTVSYYPTLRWYPFVCPLKSLFNVFWRFPLKPRHLKAWNAIPSCRCLSSFLSGKTKRPFPAWKGSFVFKTESCLGNTIRQADKQNYMCLDLSVKSKLRVLAQSRNVPFRQS